MESVFRDYTAFLDAYLISLIDGDGLARFLADKDNVYREKILMKNLESAVSRFHDGGTEYVSLTVLDNDGKELLFFSEISLDPFAEVRPEIIQFSREMKSAGMAQNWRYLKEDRESSLIIQGVAVDRRTFREPLPSQKDQLVYLVVAVEPKRFKQLLLETLGEFDGRLIASQEIVDSVPSKAIYTTVSLRDNQQIYIAADKNYIASKLQSLKYQLTAIAIIVILAVFYIAIYLVNRFIIGPVARLDNELTKVMEGRQHSIDAPDTDDEVGSLGRKFKRLYEQLHLAFQETHKQSRTDALTSLPNRVEFNEVVEKELVLRKKMGSTLSLLYIDLDNFKFVNDKFGHELGDQLLKSVASRLQLIASRGDHFRVDSEIMISRLSGDEFVVMLPGADEETAVVFAQKVLQLFTDGFSFEKGRFPVTASLGLAVFPSDGHTLTQLISNADLAMYQAKKEGKNKYSRYSQDLAKNDREIKEIESQLKSIDFDDEFSLFYMPIVNGQGDVKGCEALLRWQSPQLGTVSPALFIPVAEQSGQFEEIDLWVIERAFKEYASIENVLGKSASVSVNISSAECDSDEFIGHIQKLIRKYQVNTSNFVIEITETFALSDDVDTLDWLKRLHDLGFMIAIDDFGTGYTSLMQMVEYPVDTIKFDRQLVERIAHQDKVSLAKALVELCHLQGLRVVAEGIETPDQYEVLCGISCDLFQGYLIAKPMPISSLSEWYQSEGVTSWSAAQLS